jgi:hypothetical protein
MPGADYYRRQAEVCFRLSRLVHDPDTASWLNAEGVKFLAKAPEGGDNDQRIDIGKRDMACNKT